MKKILLFLTLIALSQSSFAQIIKEFKIEKQYLNFPISKSIKRQKVKFVEGTDTLTYAVIRIADKTLGAEILYRDNPIIYYDGNYNRFNWAPYICETPGSFRFNIEILLDKNSVEGYIDHGKLHIVEALKNPKSDQGLELKGDIKVHSFEVAEMKSIWK
jgi:hypothetical protein